MKIVLPGGAGQLGTVLARGFVAAGHEVAVLSRRPAPAPWRTVSWDGESLGAWMRELDGADVVINLAGRSVNCRYTRDNRRDILESRVRSTIAVGEAIARAERPPRTWLQASTATIYAHRFDAANGEHTGLIGGQEPDAPATWRFSLEVARAWEQALDDAKTPRTRKVALRSAVVMSPDRGGAFDTLLALARFGLGGKHGDGRQWVSWIHDRDFAAAIDWLIAHPELSGPVNLAAPRPLPNADFMRALREAWGARVGLPATRWMLELGTFLLGTESELVLKSRRVVPVALTESGFAFDFVEWPAAAEDLVRRWRESRRRRTATPS